ncbi:MAG: hypothetical protein ACTTKY_00590 [Catonella sp.]
MTNIKNNIKGLALDLQEIQEIKIEDYSSYVAGKSSNGGCYIYGTTFTREGNKWFRVDWSSCELLDNEYSRSSIGEILSFLAYVGEEMEISVF